MEGLPVALTRRSWSSGMELALQVLIGVVGYTTFLLIVIAIRRRDGARTGGPRHSSLTTPRSSRPRSARPVEPPGGSRDASGRPERPAR